MVTDPRHKRLVMNMQLRQGFVRPKPIRLKISQKKPDFLDFFISKKARISKSGFKKSKLATQDLRMRIKYARKLSIFCYV